MSTAVLRALRPHRLEKMSAPSSTAMQEYQEFATLVGVGIGDLRIKQLEHWLATTGITVFDLAAVQKYMNAKSKAEGSKSGWLWRPLRAKDRIKQTFGVSAKAQSSRFRYTDYDVRRVKVPGRKATDHYGPRHTVYTHQVPLHALKKVANIEAALPESGAVFMISDYAPKPTPARPRPLPDPFLMVCIPNDRLGDGVGRWVIDFWNEPGFGLKQQLGL